MIRRFFQKTLLLGLAFFSSGYVFGTTCSDPGSTNPAVWDAQLCGLTIIKDQSRCWLDPQASSYFRMLCAPNTVGCDQIPGGCIGSLTPGNWAIVFIMEGGVLVQRRCICGCVGEESVFTTSYGEITGTNLIALDAAKKPLPLIMSSDEHFGFQYSPRSIFNVAYGSENEPAFEVHTETGKSITLSSKHPVVVMTQPNSDQEMHQAQVLKAGEYLVSSDGKPEQIVSIKKTQYKNRVVNFDVNAESNGNHVVIVNGYKMGDNAWQQYLVRNDKRIMTRNDILLQLSTKK